MLPLLLLALAPAHAQEPAGVDGHNFAWASQFGEVLDPVRVWRPRNPGGHTFFVGGLFGYADRAITRVVEDADGRRTEPVLDRVAGVDLAFGWSPHERVAVHVAAPLFFTSTGPEGPEGFGVGDLRVTVPVGLVLPEQAGGFGLSVIPFLDAPTGDDARFLGAGGLGGGGLVALGYGRERFSVDLNAGWQQAPRADVENVRGGGRLLGAVGAGVALVDWLGLRAEAVLAAPVQAGEVAGAELPAEVIVTLRGRHDPGISWTLGGAAGVSRGVGAPRYRLLAGLGGTFGPRGGLDRDGDGIVNRLDQCPREPEVFNGHADDDGCPDQLASLVVDVRDPDGAPLRDARILLEGKALQGGVELLPGATPTLAVHHPDHAPAEEAVGPLVEGENTVPVTLPWLPGTARVRVVGEDGAPVAATLEAAGPDGATRTLQVADRPLQVRLTPGAWSFTGALDGHEPLSARVTLPDAPGITEVEVVARPERVTVTGEALALREAIFFGFDRAEPLPASLPALQAVARALAEHPEITRVEIQGHTDDIGTDDYNLDLSQRRVDAVRRLLVGYGVAPGRLVARGYGEARPLVPNADEAARAQNRRVQFVILARE